MFKLKKKDLNAALSKWSREFCLYAPSKDGVSRMDKWDGTTDFIDWYRNTVIPTKGLFLPPMEEMFQFHKNREGQHLELPQASETKSLIFGVRPCDARALAIIDKVFQDTYEDGYYLPKRRQTVLIGLSCNKPYDSCFCTSLGLNPAESADVDLMLTDIGDELIAIDITNKGKHLLAMVNAEEATPQDEVRVKEIKESASRKIVRQVKTENIDNRVLASFEDKEYWEKAAAKCVSCGICTFLCPTCYCFDINDEMTDGKGARFRNWDSCSFPLYTKMPMENPREEKWQRVRQRVGHKYAFYPRLFGSIACTGCGRCIRLCPVNWDITKTLANLPQKVDR